MTSLKILQDQLLKCSFHLTWELENKCIKQFKSLERLINEHIDDSPGMVIEGLLFKSYLYFSKFKGNTEKNKRKAMECINEVRRQIEDQDISRLPLNSGYLSITIALEALFDRHDPTKLDANIRKLRELESRYKDNNMFNGSILATKGFALSRVGMRRYSESIKAFEEAVNLCPKEKDFLFSLGFIRWRLAKASASGQNRFCPEMNIVLNNFYSVLKMDSNHSYALVLMAEIKRRQNRIDKANYFLKSALDKIPVRRRVLGEAIGLYRRMKSFPKAIQIIHEAEKLNYSSSFIHHQSYLVYRQISLYPVPKMYHLQKAIDADPTNIAARFDHVKELTDYNEAKEYYNQLLENFDNDPGTLIRIRYQLALFLQEQKKEVIDTIDAIDRFQEVVDLALKEFQEDGGPPTIFFMEVNFMVQQSIKHIESYHENVLRMDSRNTKSRFELGNLKEKIGDEQVACFHRQIELGLNIDEERKWTILKYLADVKTKNSDTLCKVDGFIKVMEQLPHPKYDVINECKAALALKRGNIALCEGRREDAITSFKESVKFGNLPYSSKLSTR
ncbi:interferon-induced protein with tetratricopeptide repeats 1B-like [Antedon mediterranea]|uniref:interferon-induced protein with tetratricopeptide repeats 1B-like n=1 Tax=Antedon mediterranea TaxID=105859 RepID=UPI003AF6A9B1